MEKPSIYLETSFISYLVGNLNRDHIILTRQILSRDFWNSEIHKYRLSISQTTIDEISRGDKEMALKREEKIKNLELLELNEDIMDLAEIYFERLQIPEKAKPDSLHLSVASFHEISYILTWNLTHLANPVLIVKFDRINQELGKFTPLIVTPENLL